MVILGNYIPYSSRSRYTDFGIAMLTVFQCLSGENWNSIMQESITATGDYWVIIYFILVMIAGQFLALNLFLAIMLSDFNCGDEPDFGAMYQSIKASLCSCCMAAPPKGDAEQKNMELEGGWNDDSKEDNFFTPSQLARMTPARVASKSSTDLSEEELAVERKRSRSESQKRKSILMEQNKQGSAELVSIQRGLKDEI